MSPYCTGPVSPGLSPCWSSTLDRLFLHLYCHLPAQAHTWTTPVKSSRSRRSHSLQQFHFDHLPPPSEMPWWRDQSQSMESAPWRKTDRNRMTGPQCFVRLFCKNSLLKLLIRGSLGLLLGIMGFPCNECHCPFPPECHEITSPMQPPHNSQRRS